MTAHNGLRLLPWTTPDGNPSYLSTDDANSHLSRLADTIEAKQLDVAAELVAHALGVLEDEKTEVEDLRRLSAEPTGALQAALRVATSRGHRLPVRVPTLRHEGADNRARAVPSS